MTAVMKFASASFCCELNHSLFDFFRRRNGGGDMYVCMYVCIDIHGLSTHGVAITAQNLSPVIKACRNKYLAQQSHNTTTSDHTCEAYSHHTVKV